MNHTDETPMNDQPRDRDPQTAHFLQSSSDGTGIIALIDAIRNGNRGSIIAL